MMAKSCVEIIWEEGKKEGHTGVYYAIQSTFFLSDIFHNKVFCFIFYQVEKKVERMLFCFCFVPLFLRGNLAQGHL